MSTSNHDDSTDISSAGGGQHAAGQPTAASVDDARSFALSEDWLATIVGLSIVLLTAAGVITEGWLPL